MSCLYTFFIRSTIPGLKFGGYCQEVAMSLYTFFIRSTIPGKFVATTVTLASIMSLYLLHQVNDSRSIIFHYDTQDYLLSLYLLHQVNDSRLKQTTIAETPDNKVFIPSSSGQRFPAYHRAMSKMSPGIKSLYLLHQVNDSRQEKDIYILIKQHKSLYLLHQVNDSRCIIHSKVLVHL